MIIIGEPGGTNIIGKKGICDNGLVLFYKKASEEEEGAIILDSDIISDGTIITDSTIMGG